MLQKVTASAVGYGLVLADDVDGFRLDVLRRGIASLVTVTKFRRKRALKARRKPVHAIGLKYRGIVPKTRQRYERSISTFFRHLSSCSMGLAGSWSDLDRQVADYIDHMFLEGEPVGYAGDLLSGLSRFVPGSRLRMPTARLWFRNWQVWVERQKANG